MQDPLTILDSNCLVHIYGKAFVLLCYTDSGYHGLNHTLLSSHQT